MFQSPRSPQQLRSPLGGLMSPEPGSPSLGNGGFQVEDSGESDNIFDRIRKMEMENKQDDFAIDPDASNRGGLLPLSGSHFHFFNSSSGSRLGMNQSPPSPQEVVSKLNDDPCFIRPFVSGESLSLDEVGRFFTSLTNESFSAAFNEITDHLSRLNIIYSLSSTMGQLHDLELSTMELENILCNAFKGRQVNIWYHVPTAHVLFSPTTKTRISPGNGIIGKCAQNQKRRIIANPKESEWFNAATDSVIFETATCAVVTSLADPLTHELTAVVSIAAKNVWTNFDTLLLDHLETKLPHLLATLQSSAYKIRSTLAILSSATGNELKQRPLISTACQSLKSALNCEMAQIFFVNWQAGILEFYGGGIAKKQRVPLDNGGIAAFVAQEGTLVNIPVASEHPHFGKLLDDEFRSRSVIAAPMINEASPSHEIFGVTVCRAKRGSSVFDQHDAVLLESLAAVNARTLTNFQRYRADVLNLKRVLTAQDHYIELLTTAESLSSVIDKDQLFEMIMTRSRKLVSADRCSLFTTDKKREYLLSKVASGTSRSIVMPISQGIAGSVATSGTLINIPDAYNDPRFNKDVDLSTGYRTKSILCLPIIGRGEATIGVTQMINKQGDPGVFTTNDVDLMKAFNVFCGIALSNANLFDDTNTMKRRVEGLLQLAMSMSREQSLPLVLERISESAVALINAERCTVYLMNQDLINDSEMNHNLNASKKQTQIIEDLQKNKKAINILDTAKDSRYDPSNDQINGFLAKTYLAAPILDEEKNLLGVVQLLNKVPGYDGLAFTDDDEKLVTAMASFAGFSITRIKSQNINAHSETIFDLFSSGMEQLAVVMQTMRLSPEEETLLISPSANMRIEGMNLRIRLILNCFLKFNLLDKLKIPFVHFFQSIMLFQGISSDLAYHNTNHALDTLQGVVCILNITNEYQNFEDIELFALLMAALLHDTGHEGENGGYVARSQLPLDILFKDQPPVESNHAYAAIQLLTNKKVDILENFDISLKQKFWNIFVQLILSSGTYKQSDFVQLWKSGDHSKLNVMRLIMKLGNMLNVARPHSVAMNHAKLLRQELETVVQEERAKFGTVPDPKLQSILDCPIETSQLKFATDVVLPMLEIATSTWRGLDIFRQQLLENMKRWKDAK